MAENKTKATDASVEDYFAAIDDEARRKDCEALADLMAKATQQPPRMWGASIVGFGSYHYRYASGREGGHLRRRVLVPEGRHQRVRAQRRRRRRGAAVEAGQAQGGKGLRVHQEAQRRRSESTGEARGGRGGGTEA